LFVISSLIEKKDNPSSLTLGLGNPSNNENCHPEGRLVLERLRLLDRQLAAEVSRKTSELICLRLAVA
jgi:hypothetical protein